MFTVQLLHFSTVPIEGLFKQIWMIIKLKVPPAMRYHLIKMIAVILVLVMMMSCMLTRLWIECAKSCSDVSGGLFRKMEVARTSPPFTRLLRICHTDLLKGEFPPDLTSYRAMPDFTDISCGQEHFRIPS